MFYPARRLKGNKACELPENVVFVDTESIPIDDEVDNAPMGCPQRFRLGVAVGYRRRKDQWYAESWLEFKRPEVFWAWCQRWCRKKSPAWVFAHNWDFDAQALDLCGLVDRGWFKVDFPKPASAPKPDQDDGPRKKWVGMWVTETSPWIVKGFCPSGLLTLCDTMNYFNMSLSSLGDKIGKPKYTMPAFSEDDATWFSYCRRDVEIISDAVRGLMMSWRSQKRGNWQFTAARLAMTHYKHIRKDFDILIHKVPAAKAFERLSYFGGEFRAFYQGLYPHPCYYVDVRSMYASVMEAGEFPRQMVYWSDGEKKPCEWQDQWAPRSIAEVTLDTFEGHYPVRSDRRLLWPRGRFNAILAGDELADAVRNGAVEKVHRWATYDCKGIFRGYSRYWLAERQRAAEAGEPLAEHLAKIMGNYLYGKWAAIRNKWDVIECQGQYDKWSYFIRPNPETKRLGLCRAVGPTVQRKAPPDEREDTFIAIASFVTAAARLRVRRVREALPGQSVLLQQSDGLLLTAEGYDALRKMPGVCGERPGQFRLVHMYEYCDILSCSGYRTDQGEKIAGLPSVRVQVGPDTFKVWNIKNLNNVVGVGPPDRIEWESRTVSIRAGRSPMRGEIGAWLDKDLTSPIVATTMAEASSLEC